MSNMGSKPPARKPTGRPVSDDRGNASWEWTGDGELNTERLNALTEGLAVAEGAPPERRPKTPGMDPYNKRAGAAPLAPEAELKPRTLDDMRRLSEDIKRKRRAQS